MSEEMPQMQGGSKIENPLSKEEALDEAALLEAFIDQIPRSSHQGAREKEPTAEEYDNALKAIEELRTIAATETNKDKIMAEMRKLAARVIFFPKLLDLKMEKIAAGSPQESMWAYQAEHNATGQQRGRVDALRTASERLEQLKKSAQS